MRKNNLIPFFDCAYQGFATGDLAKDAWAVRYFVSEGFQLFASQSFAKNMGLYGERVGALHVVLPTKDSAERVVSQIKVIIRGIYSSPSRYGATIAATILNSPQLYAEWETELRDVVAARIKEVRTLLRT
uniref:Aspartate aminotransferase n=1 Tax=Noccaea caerulescens TaxID=107243 RepID=A0A1J3JD87_NOCCA